MMDLNSIFHDTKAYIGVAPVSLTGVAHVDGAGIDTAGYEGVAFICSVGVIAGGATVSFKAQGCATDTDGSYTDITGADVTFADTDDGKVAIIDVHAPVLRWVRIVATNGAAFAALVSAQAIAYNAHSVPVTQVGVTGAFVTGK